MKVNKKTKTMFALYCALVLCLTFAAPAYAGGDPIAVVNNLSEFSAPVSGR